MGEISPSQIIQWLAMGIGLVGVWFRSQFKIERLEEKLAEHIIRTDKKHDEFERQKDALWKWIDVHEKDTEATREKIFRELSELKGTQLVTSEQFKQVLGMLQDFKNDFTEIKNRLSQLEHRD